MNNNDLYKDELEEYALKLCDMLRECAQEMTDAMRTEFRIMESSLRHNYCTGEKDRHI